MGRTQTWLILSLKARKYYIVNNNHKRIEQCDFVDRIRFTSSTVLTEDPLFVGSGIPDCVLLNVTPKPFSDFFALDANIVFN